jgi:hypothetical protein
MPALLVSEGITHATVAGSGSGSCAGSSSNSRRALLGCVHLLVVDHPPVFEMDIAVGISAPSVGISGPSTAIQVFSVPSASRP